MAELTPAQHEQAEALFHRALEMAMPERRAYLDSACSDPVVRREVESLLAVRSSAGDLMDAPLLGSRPVDVALDAATSTHAADDSGAAQRIGPYRLLDKLGEGGMGTVYLAEQTHPLQRRVALKLIKPGMDTRQVIARFEGERQALALMNHPNIARVLEAGTTDQERPYFVMEYVQGLRITDYCDHKRLRTAQRLELFSVVCRAIQHAHQKGIIHRDIKPSNVLVSGENGDAHPKVIDFGVAKAMGPGLTERTLFTEQGQLIGTPEYMSPEQADLNAVDIDTRTDIYSLGVLLYELLTGALPMDSQALRRAGFSELQQLIREQEPPKPSTRLSILGPASADAASNRRTDSSTLQRQLRGDLDWVVMKCLEKDRGRRYESAAALADDIDRYRRHEPVLAGPPSVNYRARKFLRRHRALVGGAAAVFIVLLAGLISTAVFAVRESRQRAAAETQAKITRAVNEFLNEMLASADPRQQGPEVTVREVLDQAAARVEAELAEHPAVERSVRQTIGKTYQGLGLYDQAFPHFERAKDLARRLHGERSPEAAVSMDDLGGLLRGMGRPGEAEALHRQAMVILIDHLGPRHEQVAGTMNNLAQVLYDQGKHDEGRPLYHQAFEMRSQLPGEEDPAFVTSLNNLARARYTEGDYAAAETMLRECLQLMRELMGDTHPDTIGQINNVAFMAMTRGNFAESEQLFLQAIDSYRRIYGEAHPNIALALNNLGESVRRQGRHADAESIHREALAMRRQTLGEDHPQVAKSLNNLGLTLTHLERYEEALELHAQALSIRRAKLGEQHPDVATSLNNEGFVFYKLDRCDEARGRFGEALEIRTAAYGDRHPQVANTLMNLARCLVVLGEHVEAASLCRQALEMQLEKLGEDHPDTAATRIILGRALTLSGRHEDAESALLAAVDTLRQRFDEGAPQVRGAYEELIALYEAWGQSDRAAEYRRLLDVAATP